MRKSIIAGNWKMNKNIEEAMLFANEIKDSSFSKEVEAVICAPFMALYPLQSVFKDTTVKLGAQNMHYKDNGAYTGEISASMLKDAGITYVILGHSERRQYFGETDEIVNEKVKKALEKELIPILCVGETLEEREASKEKEVIAQQVQKALVGISEEEMKRVVIAYEPVWAIGTGKTATSEQANEIIAFIRMQVKELFGEVSQDISILYGGSVKPENIFDIMAQSDIDGALVGGAALKPESFVKLVNYKE